MYERCGFIDEGRVDQPGLPERRMIFRPADDEGPLDIATFWDIFIKAHPSASTSLPEVVSFGDSSDARTEFAHLVVAGKKRATTSALQSFRDAPLPEPGDLFVVVDGRSLPKCVCEITAVEVRPFSEVDAIFAVEEGEGDLTLDWWRTAHRSFFQKEASRECFVFDDDSLVVLEHFEVIWKPG